METHQDETQRKMRLKKMTIASVSYWTTSSGLICVSVGSPKERKERRGT